MSRNKTVSDHKRDNTLTRNLGTHDGAGIVAERDLQLTPRDQPGHREKPGQRRTGRRTRPRTTAIRRPAQLTPLSPPARRRQGCAAAEDPLRVQNSPIALLAYLLQEGLERVDHVAVTGGVFLTCLRVFFTVRRPFLGRGSAG